MFNNLDPKNKEIDDIFADTDSAPAAASNPVPVTPRPMTPPMPGAAINNPAVGARVAAPTAAPLSFDDEETGHKSSMGRVLKKLFVVILLLALVAGAAYFIYNKFLLNNAKDLQNNVENTPVVPNQIQNEPETPIVTSTPATTTATTTIEVDVDTDSDGLTDAEEQILGTDPALADTDGDGLTDGDEMKTYITSPILKDTDGDLLEDEPEVKTYKTDPNNPDTDADGYNDGAEVTAGYNPNGAGKLQ